MRRRVFLLGGGVTIFLPFLFGQDGPPAPPPLPEPTPAATPTAAPTPTSQPPPEPFERDGSGPDYYPFLIFSGDPVPPAPSLQELAGDAATDAEIVGRVVDYYDSRADDLAAIFAENDPARLGGLFAMHLIHISHSYGAAPYPNYSFVDYLSQPFSHCGPQTYFLGQLLTGLGLEYRRVWLTSHAWVEVWVNGRLEILDPTGNVWIDRDSFELINGGPRTYRRFYTPWSDPDRPEARQIVVGHEAEPLQYTPGAMRSHLPGLGIYFFNEEYREQTGAGLVVLGD